MSGIKCYQKMETSLKISTRWLRCLTLQPNLVLHHSGKCLMTYLCMPDASEETSNLEFGWNTFTSDTAKVPNSASAINSLTLLALFGQLFTDLDPKMWLLEFGSKLRVTCQIWLADVVDDFYKSSFCFHFHLCSHFLFQWLLHGITFITFICSHFYFNCLQWQLRACHFT